MILLRAIIEGVFFDWGSCLPTTFDETPRFDDFMKMAGVEYVAWPRGAARRSRGKTRRKIN